MITTNNAVVATSYALYSPERRLFLFGYFASHCVMQTTAAERDAKRFQTVAAARSYLRKYPAGAGYATPKDSEVVQFRKYANGDESFHRSGDGW